MKLKPCPFCGGKAEQINYADLFNIGCLKCRIKTDMSLRNEYAVEQAIQAWNRRVKL